MVEEFKCQGAPDKTARSVNLPAWGSGPVSSSVFKASVDVGLMSGTAAGQFYRPITLVVGAQSFSTDRARPMLAFWEQPIRTPYQMRIVRTNHYSPTPANRHTAGYTGHTTDLMV